MPRSDRTTLTLALTGLFVTSLVSAQLLGSKLAIMTLPLLGAVTYPAGTFAYAGTFFASDVTSELLGKDTARWLVNVGFAMNFVMLALVWLAIAVPHGGGVPQSTFATALGSSTNVVAGSLLAYLVSQNYDVIAFHWLRERTEGRQLWLRNVGSTGTSQLLDTVVFTLVAFWAAPTVLGVGVALPPDVLATTIVGQYVLKLAIALLDTPLVYAAVGYVRNRADLRPAPEAA